VYFAYWNGTRSSYAQPWEFVMPSTNASINLCWACASLSSLLFFCFVSFLFLHNFLFFVPFFVLWCGSNEEKMSSNAV